VPELAGAKVKGDVHALAEGETLVLTLADAPLLDAKGAWDEEAADTLENALQAQEAARAKARRAASKGAKPLWQEDGRVRGLLDKYDEEEADAVAAFDEAGQLAAAAAHAADVQRRLAESAAALAAAGDGGEPGAIREGGDYQTAAEVAAAEEQQLLKKKKKKRKLRKAGGEEGPEQQQQQQQANGGLDLDALEAEAAAAGGDRDRGSRADRSSRAEAAAAKAAAAAADKAARFGAALEKANWASTFLRPGAAAPSAGEDAGDEELIASLARARRMAQQAGKEGKEVGGGGEGPALLRTEELAARMAARRAADELQERAALTARADGEYRRA
jgi:U4/U6.U5 tri-snRNP-associated protein 1